MYSLEAFWEVKCRHKQIFSKRSIPAFDPTLCKASDIYFNRYFWTFWWYA